MNANGNVAATPEAYDFFTKAEKIMVRLYSRWLDEQDYEHLDTYMQPLSEISEQCGVELRAMTKRPFGVKIAVADRIFHVFVKRNTYAYKRIK